MSSVIISGDTSGAVTVAAPAVAGTNTLTLQAATATNAINTLGTAVASTSGTSIDFTGLPAFVKRITVMFQGVSTSGTSVVVVRLGTTSGVVVTSYVGASGGTINGGSAGVAVYSTGFAIDSDMAAARAYSGNILIHNISGNTWVESHSLGESGTTRMCTGGGNQALSATLDRIRITTVNGTDAFDAGTVNILLEG